MNLQPKTKQSSPLALVSNLPKSWRSVRLKRWVSINEKNLPEDTDPTYKFHYIEIGAVANGGLTEKPKAVAFQNAPSRARRIVRQGDTIVSTVRTYLKAVWFADKAEDLICSTGFAVLSPKPDTVPKFVTYLAQSAPFISRVTANSVGTSYPAIPESKFADIEVPVPPIEEQAAIVRHLDHADELISRYISAKERLIALLEEQRQAVIHRAVTRGLDPSVPLKPSGVSQLGDVPKHWWVIQLGRLGTFSKGGGGTKEDEVPEGLPCVRYGDIYTSHKYFVRQTRSFIARYRTPDYVPMKYGDILFTGSGETIDEIGKSVVNLIDGEAYCGGDVILLRLNEKTDPKFFGYLLDSPQTAKQKSCMGRGITIMHVYSSQLKYLWLALPPLEEQTKIGQHIETTARAINDAATRAQHQIDLMHEYRTRLIADVVTGQLDVRERACNIPA